MENNRETKKSLENFLSRFPVLIILKYFFVTESEILRFPAILIILNSYSSTDILQQDICKKLCLHA